MKILKWKKNFIDAMLLNLEVPVPQQTKRKFVNLSVFKNFIKFQIFQNSKKKKNLIFKILNFWNFEL
jgi:hypothetical protein